MKKVFIFTILLFCFGFVQAQNLEDIANVNPTMLERAKQFKKALGTSNGFRSGVYIYQKRSIKEYEKNPSQLAARLALLGFTDVYLGAGRMIEDENIDEIKWVCEFNIYAHKYGMKVHIESLSSSRLWVDNKPIFKNCNDIINFNYSNKKEIRFDGITADLEPHIQKKGFIERPKEIGRAHV